MNGQTVWVVTYDSGECGNGICAFVTSKEEAVKICDEKNARGGYATYYYAEHRIGEIGF